MKNTTERQTFVENPFNVLKEFLLVPIGLFIASLLIAYFTEILN